MNALVSPLYASVIALANAAARVTSAVAADSESKLSRTLRARTGLLQRWKQLADIRRDTKRKLVWFHAPSVGEGLQARPVIELLRAEHPDIQIAYSFFSPSAEKFASGLNVDMAEYLPFDSASAAEQMITLLTPDALFFSKLDVWPNLVQVAHKRGVRTGLLSATVAPRSGRQGGFARALLHDAYAALDVVGAIDAENAERLAQMGARRERISVSGDTRFDQVWARAQSVDRSSELLASLNSTRPTLVAGSTWPADEAVLLPAWLELRARLPQARLIIAPHEPTDAHVSPIAAWAVQSKLHSVKLGELATPEPRESSPDVIIVDRVGVLGSIYAVADIAFVGGGFHAAGLHSVIEPAAFGIPVLFGPSHHMSREAGLLLHNSAAVSVRTITECTAALFEFLSDSARRTDVGARASRLVQSELGAGRKSLALVVRALAGSAAL